MQMIPVLDLLNGITVQAVAGRRKEYRPIRSCLTNSTDPCVVLRQLDQVCKSENAYIADLDAILNKQPNRCTLAELSRLNLNLMVDAGIQSCEEAEDLLDLGIRNVIVGLESLPDLDTACKLIRHFGPEPLILSLDLKAGVPLTRDESWVQMEPLKVLENLAEAGFRRWIVLDLAGVGKSQGVPTAELCRQVRGLRPNDEIITGGGVRSINDLVQLHTIGIDGVLVASALHTGALTEQNLDEWRRASAVQTQPGS
ncbi:MAG: HisA/HisF-related TIM barrel protein [Fuerstiella sp.]|nr:HisA/HisF-related TIM barrel protein [Fuerstiella sp.]